MDINRRSFLKKGAVALGGVVTVTAGAEVAVPLMLPEKMEFDPNNSLWASEQPEKAPALHEHIDTDVAVIGGGYTGLSAAYFIASSNPGKKVVLFEAARLGSGASGRNGGMILPQPGNEYMDIYSDDKTHKLTYETTVANIEYIKNIVSKSGIDCDLDMKGILLVIVKESQVKQYKEYALKAKALGIPVEFYDREKTKHLLGTDVYCASLFEPNGGQIHPMKFICALKKMAESAGVTIYEDSPVHEIKQKEVINLSVGAARYKVHAGSIVLATNGYTSKLGFFKNSVMAVQTQIAVTPRLDEEVFENIGWKSRLPFSDTRNILFHSGTTRDNRILIGAGHVDYFFNNGTVYRGDISKVKALLHKELLRIYPKLEGVEFENIWSGVMGFTIDFNQSVGVTGKYGNIYYGLAYGGHGINLSVLFGRIIADIYGHGASKWIKMPFFQRRLIPMPPEPLRWVGVQANIEYYKMLDSQG